MPEFFLELFSEEIPARMQKDAAAELAKLCAAALAGLHPASKPQLYYGPRRIAIRTTIDAVTGAKTIEERGPRDTAPEAALNGFLGKHGASRSDVVVESGYYVLRRNTAAIPAAEVILKDLAAALAKFSWPKSMRWGQSGGFTWVRPLRRIVCLLDGEIIPLTLGPVTASDETEGHRVHAPGPFTVSSAAMWEEKLREHHVIADQDERRRMIAQGLADLAASRGLTIVDDNALLDEVTGLVEWPVPMIGRIDESFMSLPPEVRELSMKVNQKYFALRDAAGNPAPYFAFIANLEAPDRGAHIISGNETVLRARLSDARHFWDQDLKTPLDELLPKLEKITFHAKIGTQRERASRISHLAEWVVYQVNDRDLLSRANAAKAGLLCKADLVTGMVGEFPELQGIIGGYYAERNARDWDGAVIGPAIKTHYQPKGPSDKVPTGLVAAAVALADKLDTLREFFAYGEKPTGSGDPYALRRCALGIIRIILENNLRINLKVMQNFEESIFDFIIERLRVKLRGEGKRFDILDAVLAAGSDDDLVRLMKKVNALTTMLATEDGKNLLAAYKRAANILRIEDAKDGPHNAPPDTSLFEATEEDNLWTVLEPVAAELFGHTKNGHKRLLDAENYEQAMTRLASLRPAIDAFFENVTVNVTEKPELRLNRLRLLARFRDTVNQIADFSKIEG